MKPERWHRVKEVFHAAVKQPRADRERFVAEQCGEEDDVRSEVVGLLKSHDTAAVGDEDEKRAKTLLSITEGPGTTIGRYKILQEIGEGGFGRVFMAEQEEPIRRKVALKIIKPGMDTRQVIARFEAERQALALMDHECIAKVFDAGATDSGRPFFVMELVRGVPITQYCDDAALDTAARLKIFMRVCQAVQHAHQKGIIHRDIKPSNVLVTLHDGVPVPKIIDFGIAKATDHRLTQKTLFTEFRQIIGTPEYMSPEQADLSGLDIDTRADIYSLGVLLYELLTGTTPFEFKTVMKAGYEAVVRHIKEVDPPKPSTRLSTLGADSGAIARMRGTDARHLRSMLRGDLDWIVMKALAKDRTRRYETANGLGRDIERHLGHEPVTAGPPSLGYRTRKLVMRHRAAVGAATAILLALVGGLLTALWQYGVARRAEGVAVGALAGEREALREAVGHRLSAQAITLAREHPTTALLLAIEGATRAPGEEANSALYTVLDEHRELAVMQGHDGAVQQLALSGDDRLLLSSDSTRLAILWDVASGSIRHRFDVHDAAITALGFTADDQTAFTASLDATVRLWDVDSGESRGTIEFPAPLLEAALDPSHGRLFALGGDGVIRAVGLAGGGTPAPIVALESEPLAFAASRNGSRVAAIGRDMVAQIAETAGTAGTAPRRIQLSKGAAPKFYGSDRLAAYAAFSPDGTVLWTRALDGQVASWDCTTGVKLFDLTRPECFASTISLSPDGDLLFINSTPTSAGSFVSDDWRAEVFDARSGKLRTRLRGLDVGWQLEASFDSNASVLLTRQESLALIWDPSSGRCLGELRGVSHFHYSPRFFRDGARLAMGAQDGLVRIWALSAYEECRKLADLKSGTGVADCRLSPDGAIAVVRHLDGERDEGAIDIVDGRTGRRICEAFPPGMKIAWWVLDRHGDQLAVCDRVRGRLVVRELSSRRNVIDEPGEYVEFWFDDSGRHLIARSDEIVVIFDLARSARLATIEGERVHRAALAPDASRLVTADGVRNTATVRAMPSGEILYVIEHSGFVFDARFSPDGRRILTFANDASVQMHDALDFDLLGQATVPTTDWGEVGFSPDGRLFVVFPSDQVLLFETETLRPFARFVLTEGRKQVGFTKDGRHLFVQNMLDIVRVVSLDPLAYARSRAPRELTAPELARYDLGTIEERAERGREHVARSQSARVLINQAEAAVDRGIVADALPLLERARATRPRMPSRFHYVNACALALRAESRGESPSEKAARAEDRRAAIAALTELAATGTADARVLATSPHLISLRDDPEFGRMLSESR